MKIEVLYPELCNLYGDPANIKYLQKSCPEIEVRETLLDETPAFVKDTTDLIYMGAMTEKSQNLALEKLKKYGTKIEKLIDDGVGFLVTGNALELFGKTIEDPKGQAVECLGIFETVAMRDTGNRFNSLYLGRFAEMKIVGFKSQFSHSKWLDDAPVQGLFITERGPGLNPDIKEEGIRKNNFMATYLLGPILLLNPPFTKYLMQQNGIKDSPAFEKEAVDAYEARVAEFSQPNRGFYY